MTSFLRRRVNIPPPTFNEIAAFGVMPFRVTQRGRAAQGEPSIKGRFAPIAGVACA